MIMTFHLTWAGYKTELSSLWTGQVWQSLVIKLQEVLNMNKADDVARYDWTDVE